MKKKVYLTAALAVLTLTACGLPQEDGKIVETAANAAQPDRCLSVPAEKVQGILSGAEDGVGTLAPAGKAAAVKSDDYENVYMIAIVFAAPGMDDPELGVWASNALTVSGGTIMAVDGFAQQFTVWPDADRTDANITINDDGVTEAKDCL